MSAGWAGARRILCVRLDALGDVLMTTPAIRAVREAAPGRRVTLLASPAGAAIGRLVPEVDDVLAYAAPWMKSTAPRAGAAADLAMARRLGAGGFDGAVIFTVYSQSPLPAALLCFLAGIPRRLAHCRENPYQLLTDWVREPEPAAMLRHEVRRQLDLVATIGARPREERLSLAVPPAARARVHRRLARLGLEPGRGWVLLHPGASAPSRRYPPELFAEVGRRLALESGHALVLSGGPGEQALVERVQQAIGVPSHALAGRLDLADLAALVEAAPLLVSNNSGPVHVAGAVGTPVVDLYALTNPQHTPWGVPHRVLSHDVPCKYCYRSVCPEGHHDCLRRVRPEDVVTAALELLEATAAGDGTADSSARPLRRLCGERERSGGNRQ
jgi:lipopolysaccharide heptosyltransferase II